MKSKYLIILPILLIIMFSGCTNKEPRPINNYNKFALNIEYEDENLSNTYNQIETDSSEESLIEKEPTPIVQDVPSFIKAGKLPRKMGRDKISFLKNPSKKVKISVENIPINKFIHLIFGEVFKLNYTVSENVEKQKDSVTMRMENKITSEALYAMVESLLANYKITIQNKDGVLLINSGGGQNKSKLDYKISFGKEIQYRGIPENEMIYQIVPIEYLSLDKARDFLQEFALSKGESRIYEMKHLNALLIKDYVSNIRRGLELLTSMDKPYMKNKSFKLIHLEHIKVDKFDERLRAVFKVLNINIANDIQGEPISIVPIEEINSLFVITDKMDLINTILYWKRKLDNFEELNNEKQLFVYKTQNREAVEVDKILTKLISNTKETSTKSETDENSVKTIKSELPQDTKITVDKERNILIFYMLPSEYKNIYKLLRQIDTKAQQVLIEVTIAEVTLVDKLQYGIEWFLKNSSKDKDNWSLQTLGNLGIGSGGISGAISTTTGQLSALINGFAQDNLLNILSSPKLVVLNNKTASFTVGTSVPVITSQATASDLGSNTAGTPTLLQNVNYVQTGINTSLTPTITADNTILLKINQNVSEAQNNNTSSISSPIIINRSISTEVMLKNGQELIIGGIIKENKSNTTTKVPLLGNIPVIGNFFKTYSDTVDKTELIFIVKPHLLEKVKKNYKLIESFKKITSF